MTQKKRNKMPVFRDAQEIVKYLNDLGVNCSTIARELDVHLSTICYIRNGRRNGSIPLFVKLFDYCQNLKKSKS